MNYFLFIVIVVGTPIANWMFETWKVGQAIKEGQEEYEKRMKAKQ